MKKLIVLLNKTYFNPLLVLLFLSLNGFSQSSSCEEIEPFCSDETASLVFENTTGITSAEIGPNYSCLITTPNPAWFFLRIDTDGDLNFNIIQNTAEDFTAVGLDVDFICYGPFTSSSECNNLIAANTVACSYSTAAIENFTIPNAVVGEIYVLLITNFENSPGWIQLQQTNVGENGAGLTDCSILESFLGSDIDACVGDEITLDGTTEGATAYRWFVDTGAGFNVISGETNPTLVITTPVSGVYQVEASDDMNSDTDDVVVIFHDLPIMTTPIILQQCDDDTDGISDFNLREVEMLLTNDDPTPTFTYHLTLADADTNTGLITNLSAFSNATASQVFVRVENQFGCYDVATVNLQVSTTAIPADFMIDFNACDNDLIDNDDNNGITTFDFSSVTNTILNLFPASQNITASYYENIIDALAEENALDPTNYRNENSPFTQQIVVRVDNQDNNACLGLGFHINLIVDPLPEFDVVEEQFLCLNQLPIPLTLQVENPQDNYTYEWRDQTGVLLSPNSTISLLEVITTGDYFVTAISGSDCKRTKKVTVVHSNIATIQSIDVVDVSQNNIITINVTGEGDYEFALDDIDGVYQDNNVFENVIGGIHTVYIRDKNGCGIISEEVSVISFPKFFTPNGDGFNDTWQVSGIGFQPTSKIFIFDRFGKVIAKIDATSDGWDGRYRGSRMPSSDYWFKVTLEDGRLLKGHFSLIRR